MKRKIIMYLIILFAVSNFAFSKLDSLDYQIYSIVIKQMDKYPNNDTLTIDELATDSIVGIKLEWDWQRMKFPKYLKKAFISVNRDYELLNRCFYLHKPYKILTKQEFLLYKDTIIYDAWWDNFYKVHHNTYGIINLSKIGYNKNKTKALLIYSISHHYICEGFMILLENRKGKWKIKRWEVAFQC